MKIQGIIKRVADALQGAVCFRCETRNILMMISGAVFGAGIGALLLRIFLG